MLKITNLHEYGVPYNGKTQLEVLYNTKMNQLALACICKKSENIGWKQCAMLKWPRAAKVLQKAHFASKAQFEQQFIKLLSRDEYKPGELVLVRNIGIELSHNRKHQPRYLGPYEVDQKASEKSYSLKDLDGTSFLHRVGIFRLLPYISQCHKFMNNPEDPSDSGTDDSDSQDSGSDDSD
jgi:hypothetical protein